MTDSKKSIPELWKAFVLEIINTDKSAIENSWRWLYAISCVLGNTPAEIQKKLPDKHPLKSIKNDSKTSNKPKISEEIVNEILVNSSLKAKAVKLKKDLENLTKISKVDFSGVEFEDNIDFSNFIFPIDTSFEHAQFPHDINFINAIFLKDAVFNDAKFFANVYFNDAVFCETADFEDAIFQNEDSHRKETAKFRNTIFKKIANFRNATFWGYANFKGAKLEGRAFFQKATFKWHTPRFYDATFNNEMTWSGITLPRFAEAEVDRHTKVGEEFEPVKCYECTDCAKCVERDKCIKRAKCSECKALIEENRTRRIEENQNSYENTAILLADRKKFHDEHLFFRHEMGCRRELEKNKLICLMFLLYEILADYGYGIGRAFKAWFWHMVLGMLAIIITATCAGGIVATEILFCSFSTSIANANPFVFVIIKDGSLMDCYKELNMRSPMIFGLIRGIQTFIGVTFLFLLLTTLRVRFRLK